MRVRQSNRPCFTLFELVLVLAILIIVTGLVYPSLDAMYGGFKLTQSTDMVRAGWAGAKSHAIDEGRPYRFAVVLNKGNYRIAPDSADFWAGNSDASGTSDAINGPLVIEEALPAGIRFASTDSAAQASGPDSAGDSSMPKGSVDMSMWHTTAVFLPNGTARDDVEILFQSGGVSPLLMKMRALTGAVTVKTLNSEGNRP